MARYKIIGWILIFSALGVLAVWTYNKEYGLPSYPPLKVPVKFTTRAVHNKCLNVWAVETGFHMAFCNADTGYWGNFRVVTCKWDIGCYPVSTDKDSVDFADLGNEYQFRDSISAMIAYSKFKRSIFITDSIVQRPQFIKDSIFKCNHTYE